jgi:hypothetical protein
MLWDPLALAALNQLPSDAAAPPFVRVLAEMFGPDPAAASVLVPALPLDRLFGVPARRFIEAHGGEVRTGTAGTVALAADRPPLVRGGGVTIRSGAVVVAVPWGSLGHVFEGDTSSVRTTLERMEALQPSPILTANLWFDRPIMDELFIGFPGRPWQWVFDKQALFGEHVAHVSLVASGPSPLTAMDNPALVEGAAQQLRDALPAAARARLIRGTIIREPRATFSLAPGQPARPAALTGVPGLVLAGDWTDTGLPATIEGAVRSGHHAAALIAAAAHR